jgi:peptidoglycan/xylan/chitin deacetylase (PgdA/CDA1 family)
MALATGLPALLNWYNRRRLLVVTYHGLYDGPVDAERFPDTFVHIDQMAAQLNYLNKNYQILKPNEVLQKIEKNKELPEHAALVTFDDAYVNFKLALPLLEAFNIQPIVFVPTFYVQNRQPFWYDLVWYYFRRTSRPNFDTLMKRLKKSLAPAGSGDELKSYLDLLKRLQPVERESVIQIIQTAMMDSGIKLSTVTSDFMALTKDEICKLSGRGICFGGHTHSHTIMSAMPDEIACKEICLNKSKLEQWLDKKVDFFAYPNGAESDFHSRHKKMLQNAGYAAAFSLTQHRNSPLDDPMSIPRLHIAPEDTLDAFRFRCMGAAPLVSKVRKLINST